MLLEIKEKWRDSRISLESVGKMLMYPSDIEPQKVTFEKKIMVGLITLFIITVTIVSEYVIQRLYSLKKQFFCSNRGPTLNERVSYFKNL